MYYCTVFLQHGKKNKGKTNGETKRKESSTMFVVFDVGDATPHEQHTCAAASIAVMMVDNFFIARTKQKTKEFPKLCKTRCDIDSLSACFYIEPHTRREEKLHPLDKTQATAATRKSELQKWLYTPSPKGVDAKKSVQALVDRSVERQGNSKEKEQNRHYY